MEITIIFLICIGLILMITSIYLIKKEQKERDELNIRLDEAFVSINSALENFEQQSSDFNSTVEMIFREVEEKYQELMLLYSFIEEYKSFINTQMELDVDKNNVSNELLNSAQKTEEEVKEKVVDNSFIYKNKNATEIFKLYDEGMNIDDIAKKLSIGKGEVQLMVNIRKAK